MKRLSSQPLLCVALFLAGCVCLIVGFNPEWFTGESYGSGPAGGSIPGLAPSKPPVKTEEVVKPEDEKAAKPEAKPEETPPAKEPAPNAGTP